MGITVWSSFQEQMKWSGSKQCRIGP